MISGWGTDVRRIFARTRYLEFGFLCLALAIAAGVTASWVPLGVLVTLGAVFLVRGLTT